MPEQYIPIALHTNTGIFTGVLSMPVGVRLSEFINLPAQYLHFKEDVAINNDGSAKTVGEIHINKKAVNLLTTVNDNSKGGFTQEKVFPYVYKIPIRIKIYMTDYEISCNAHGLHEDSLTQMLERNELFLPCTDVDVRNLHNDERWHSNFAAVNHYNVSVLQKID
jgi:hypothetical protein